MTLPADYFARLYAGSPDPWGFRSRWYERRKREVTLAALDRPRYHRAFEPGCSIGVLTAALAQRCDDLLATDVDERALATASVALAGVPNVRLRRLEVPREWPDGELDLVVVSELGYYLDAADLQLLLDRVVSALAPGGALLACHWRHPVADYPASGDEVHAQVLARPELTPVVAHLEQDFRLDLMTRGTVPSPAEREGLTS